MAYRVLLVPCGALAVIGVSTLANIRKGGDVMGKRKHEFTSPRVASKAGRILQDPNSTPEEKSAAGSALTQARNKPKKKKK